MPATSLRSWRAFSFLASWWTRRRQAGRCQRPAVVGPGQLLGDLRWRVASVVQLQQALAHLLGWRRRHEEAPNRTARPHDLLAAETSPQQLVSPPLTANGNCFFPRLFWSNIASAALWR